MTWSYGSSSGLCEMAGERERERERERENDNHVRKNIYSFKLVQDAMIPRCLCFMERSILIQICMFT